MYWIIWLGNPGAFPYYLGRKRPLAVCAEDAEWFTTEGEAQEAINTACDQWRRNWPHARPVCVDPPTVGVLAEALNELRYRIAQ